MVLLKEAEKIHGTQQSDKQLAGEAAQDHICTYVSNKTKDECQTYGYDAHIHLFGKS